MTSRRRSLAGLILVALLAPPSVGAAQESLNGGWNTPEALELIRRGVVRRSSEVRDTTLRTYSARGDGYVYFLLDAAETGQESLVRTDQVAVDIHWRSPDQVRQRIVGMREQRELPITGLYYYLDRLTVVQDNYGPSIVIADGDNVNDVPHPVGPVGEVAYDYRLVDSLTLRLSGAPDPVRVHEVQVRPRDPQRPAVIGSVFLEAATGALVRMTFTFTPSAYIDPRLDYIHVTLENGLWGGRYWLPHEQRLEIRREMPELDLPFGTVIRTRMRIGDYRFNEPVPNWLFDSRLPITMAPRSEREEFEFEEPIDAGWRVEGFGSPADVEEVRQVARELVRERLLTGLPIGRLSIGSASEVFRYNRAEGPVLGLGFAARPLAELGVDIRGGWAFGARQVAAGVDAAHSGRGGLQTSAYLNAARDIGGMQPVSGAANTLGGLLFGQDWFDPYYTSGGAVSTRIASSSAFAFRAWGRLEHQRSASLTTSYSMFDSGSPPRPVQEIDRGTHLSVSMAVSRDGRTPSGGAWGQANFMVGRLSSADRSFEFGRAEATGGFGWSWSRRRSSVEMTGGVGQLFGEVPRQEIYLLGGRGSLPGYDHRAFAGDRYAVIDVQASADIEHPWIRGRLLAGVGWTEIGGAGARAADLLARPTSGGLRPTVGAGIGLFYDLLHIDVARGLGRDGRTQLIVEFPKTFWEFL
jgi:hypothetical protein